MTFRALGLIGLAVAMSAMSATPVSAHHSFAMFDLSKTVTLKGTVKEFQWIFPHAWIVMIVPDAKGQPKQWAIELESPSTLARKGFVPKTITPGMKVSIEMHPLKDGSPGGSGTDLNVTFADGKSKKL